MNIQYFADTYDELINDVNNLKKQTQTGINNLATEKQNALNTYQQNYENQLNNYNDIMKQQQNYIDTFAKQSRENQQKQTDYNINLINQNKEETQKQTQAEMGNAYIDYQKSINKFGGNAEQMSSNGLSGTGFAKNQEIAMNITYQNRVSSANSALQKANTNYDNQIQQALLNNDANLAEIALQQMQKSYQLALQGFEYRTTMENNRLNYIQNLNDSYYSKEQSLQDRLNSYNTMINNLKIERENSNIKRQQIAAEAALEREKLAFEREQFNRSLESISNNYTDSSNNAKNTNQNNPSNGKVDINKAFNNLFRPSKINGENVTKSGYTVGQLFGKGQVLGSDGKNIDDQNVWKAGNKWYIWDNAQKKYIDISSEMTSFVSHSGGGGKHFTNNMVKYPYPGAGLLKFIS